MLNNNKQSDSFFFVREYIGSEVATFVCSSYERVGIDRSIVDTEDWESPIWRDSRFKYLLNLEEKPLIRDRYVLFGVFFLA